MSGGWPPSGIPISAREAEVLAALGDHLTNAEIGARLFISVRTVESHVSSLLRKLGVGDRRELALIAPTVLASVPAPEGATPDGPACGVSSRPPAPLRPRATNEDPLLERDRPLEDLDRCLVDAIAGRGRLVLVPGPAGIGKSRLLAEVRGRADSIGARVVWAKCSELEREFAFGAARQLFEETLAVSDRDQLLAGAASPARSIFDSTPTRSSATDANEASFATLHGLYWLTVNLSSDQPLVLAVDDLQWCDSGSLRFLTYLLRRLEDLPVFVVASLRTDQRSHDQQLLDELGRDLSTIVVRLDPLTRAGAATLVRSRLGPDAEPEFCDACYDVTAGNPLLLRQLLRALAAEGVGTGAAQAGTVRRLGSQAVSSMVLSRLRRLPAESIAVARALAVLGDGTGLPVLARLAELPEDVAAQRTADLTEADIVQPSSPITFVHSLVREAVYDDLAPGERELMHERAAGWLDRSGASAEQIAAQLLLAPARSNQWNVDVLRRAATEAIYRGAPDGAATYLRRALDEPPTATDRPDVLLDLARAEASVNGIAALEHLEAAYQTLADPGRRAVAALALARTMIFGAPRGAAAEFARSAREQLPPDSVDAGQGLLAIERVSVHIHGLDADTWPLAVEGDVEPAIEGRGQGAKMLAADLAWERLCAGRPLHESASMARLALSGETLFTADEGLLWSAAMVALDLADVDITPQWDSAMARAHQSGSLFSVLSISLWRGHSLLRRGELPEAEESLRGGVGQFDMWLGATSAPPYGVALLASLLLERDRVDEARALLKGRRPIVVNSDADRMLTEAQAQVLLVEGRYAEALPVLQASKAALPHLQNPAWRGGPALEAQALHGLGRDREAADILTVEIERARRWGAPSTLGRLLRLRGDVTVATDRAAGLHDLIESRQELSRAPARLQYGKTLRALGVALLAGPAAERDEAISLLQLALEIAESCSSERLRRTVADALSGAGAPVPPGSSAALSVLGSTGRKVLALADSGIAPKQIAQSLFLTPGMVERILETARRGG
jgi:DNA-binding NarL/FixJ family response regulator